MRPIAPVFFVTEAEYSELQAACAGDFPFTYAEFVRRVEEGTDAIGESARVIRVQVRVSEFLAWCSEQGRPADGRARAEYAAIVGAKAGLN